MAKKKAEHTEPVVDQDQGKEAQPAAQAEQPKVTKIEAVREALREIGRDAKNSDLEDYIRRKYGDGAVPGNMSVAKSNARKEGKGKAKAKPSTTGTRAAYPRLTLVRPKNNTKFYRAVTLIHV